MSKSKSLLLLALMGILSLSSCKKETTETVTTQTNNHCGHDRNFHRDQKRCRP